MVLHPVGGDFTHLVRIITIGRISHIIAIASIPLIAYGFQGLSKSLESTISDIAYFFMLFGLIAVLFAGAVNGLILMDFVESHRDASDDVIESLKPFLRLIRSINHAFDFIFIGAVCISTGIWSALIIYKKRYAPLIGWLGLLLTSMALVSLFAGFVFVDLTGFQIFIFGWVAWVISLSYQLMIRISTT